MRLLKQAVAANVMVLMTDSADHVTGKTGLTLTITASKDGGAFASISPTVTERGSGWYAIALSAADTNTLGDLALHVSATGADPTDLACRVVGGNLDADVSTRLAASSYAAPLDAAGTRSALGLAAANLDSQLSAIAGYVDALEPNVLLALKLLRNKVVTDQATGIMTVYDDDSVTPLYTATIWQDAAGTTGYAGAGINNRARLS